LVWPINRCNIFLNKPLDAIVQANSGNIDAVIIAGRILKKDGKLTEANLNDLRERAKQANTRLLQKSD
jgi:cytosine/adenosine deaminase-related metal-dependent hydrolase